MQRTVFSFDFAVIGAGIVGLAIAARLSSFGSTIIMERNSRPLLETSTKNSGVVHAGLYYPADSLKTKLCVAGNRWIWEQAGQPHSVIQARKCGKWIIACNDEETSQLHTLKDALQQRGMPWRFVPQSEVRDKEPELRCVECLESPDSGIVDVHSLARHYENEFNSRENGSLLLTNSEAKSFSRAGSGAMNIEVFDRRSGASFVVAAPVVVNAAGLFASRVAAKIRSCASSTSDDLDADLQQTLVRGNYAALCGKQLLSRLVYPCPLPGLAGLGTHSVIGMCTAEEQAAGSNPQLLFGPNVEYVSDVEQHALLDHDSKRYAMPAAESPFAFLDATHVAVSRYLPSLQRSKLRAAWAGLRPKISTPQRGEFRDFTIKRDDTIGDVVVVHCCGIESPGLTASSQIADYVCSLVQA